MNLEIWHSGKWHDAGVLTLGSAGDGYLGRSSFDYDLGYVISYEPGDGSRSYHQEMSVCLPINLNAYSKSTWPSFLLDLLPQGHARRRLVGAMRLNEDARSTDLPLLMRAASNPVGNIRIREAVEQEEVRIRDLFVPGISEEEILEKGERFTEVIENFGILASGSSGLQGEWPKMALTQKADGLFYPDSTVSDDEALRHVIVKILKSNKESDAMTLEAEAGYSQIAKDLGLNVFDVSSYRNGVLMIPRFDREVTNGAVIRHGQESMVSALGISEFAHRAKHEDYIGVLKQHSSNPFEDIVEYIKRDIANLALGNPDNHGRNTALRKKQDGRVELAPLFDFAPMKLSEEAIGRSTRWEAMNGKLEVRPDWNRIACNIFDDDDDATRLLEEIASFAQKLSEAPKLARKMGLPDRVCDTGMAACDEIVRSVETSAENHMRGRRCPK